MPPDKWDYYKVRRGTRLAQSKKSPGAVRGLVHGKKGVRTHAEFFKLGKNEFPTVGRKRPILGRLLILATKCLLVVLAVGGVLSVAALLVTAVANGVAAGFADLEEPIAAASELLILGAGVALLIAVAIVGAKMARAIARRRARASVRAAARRAALAEASSHTQQTLTSRAAASQAPTSTHLSVPVDQAVRIPAGWYPDPTNPGQLRYWSGSTWTEHVEPTVATGTAMAGWYPAPFDPTRLRYWDGTMWTDHLTPRNNASPATRRATASWPYEAWDATGHESRFTMSSAEWQAHVRAWMAAGAVEQELWRRLSNAEISDADARTLEVQRRMEELTAEQGVERVRLMLEANPGLRNVALSDFLTYFLNNLQPLDRNSPERIDRAPGRR